MKRVLAAVLMLGAVVVFGCGAETEEPGDPEVGEAQQPARGGGKPICALKCAAPPEGCRYEGAVLSGPCNKLTCGTLVCDGSDA